MEKIVLGVEGMSCMHCSNAVTNAVGALGGVSSVQVDLEGKTVTIEFDSGKATLGQIKAAIEEEGYEVA